MVKTRLSLAHVVAALVPLAFVHVLGTAGARASESAPASSSKPHAPPASKAKATGLPNPGQLSSLFRIDDADPESSVPTPAQRDGNPLEYGYYIQDLLAKAEAAAKKHDQQAVIRYYRALAISVPDHAQGWSLLCEAYEKANERPRALGACKYAIDREGAQLKDYVRFVRLITAKDGALLAEERTALDEALAHLDKEPGMAVPAAQLRCEAAVKLKDPAAMETCTATLAKEAPNDAKTIVFQWSLAMMRGQSAEAARLVDRAKAAGVPADGIARMTTATASGRWPMVRGLAAVAVVAGTLLALFLARRRLIADRRLAGDMAAPPMRRG